MMFQGRFKLVYFSVLRYDVVWEKERVFQVGWNRVEMWCYRDLGIIGLLWDRYVGVYFSKVSVDRQWSRIEFFLILRLNV